jgi:hypothetical protein
MRDPTSDVDFARHIIDYNPAASSEYLRCDLQNRVVLLCQCWNPGQCWI